MISILAANLLRRPGRTLLTALGTAVGVATIVALLAVTDGLQSTAGELVHLGRADLGLFQRDAADPTTSVLPVALTRRIARRPGVASAQPVALLVEQLRGQPAALVFGGLPDGFLNRRLVMIRGRPMRTGGEVTIGDRLAASAGLTTGDTVTIGGRAMRIVGIHHAGVLFEDTGAVIPLATAQAIAGRPGEATSIVVTLKPGAKPAEVRADIARAFPGLTALDEPNQALRGGANGELVRKAATVIVVLALVIGGLAVMNTMLLAALERRGEFALMSAVGWSPVQVATLVLGEGAATGMLGATIGIVLGVFGSDLLVSALGASEFVDPQITAWAIGRGLLVGGAIGVVGGLYPAWRVSRLRPAAVLAGR